jgi:predicted PurR-regulated permease PerM
MHTQHLGMYFLLALLVGALVLTYFIFQPFLAPLVLALIFAVILNPLYRRILHTIPRWPSLASLITVLISIIIILVPVAIIGTQVGIEARNLYTQISDRDTRTQIQTAANDLERVVARYVPAASGFTQDIPANISQYAEGALQWIIQHIGTAASGLASILLKAFLFFIALYYLLRDGRKLKNTLVHLSPLKDTYDESIADKLELAVNSIIKGNLTIALIQGSLTAIGFTIFGVPNSILWGTVTAIAALIPGLGTGLVFIPTVLFMYFSGHTGSALGLTIWGIVAVGMIDNFLGPQLIGRGVNLHPLLVLLSVLGGLAFFGPIGLFLGPLAISLLFAFLSIYADIAQRRARA